MDGLPTPTRNARRRRDRRAEATVATTAGVGASGEPGPLPDEALDALITVLDEIRLGRSSSRGELIARTGLSRGIVGQRVGELLDRGLVVEGDPGPSTGGRPPRQLSFHGDAGHVLVADIGATSIDVAVTTLDGRILGHFEEPADVAAGPDAALARVEQLFDRLLAAGRGSGRLWGVGIGVPGPVEFRTGRPISPPIMPGWDGYPVRERLSGRFDAPVWVDNDVNVLALGEWRAGVAVGHDNVIVVKVGTGIGAGIIADGHLHRGAQGAAGDVGHIQVSDDRDVLCRCGNTGCLEAMAGGGAIARDAQQVALDGRSPRLAAILAARGAVTAEDVARAASQGDLPSAALLQGAGGRIGLMLASVVNFFNPSLVVIGGGVAQGGDVVLDAIREAVYRRSLPLATRELAIRRSSLGGLAGVIGASAMVVDQLFSREAPEPLGRSRRAVRDARGRDPRRGLEERCGRLVGKDDEPRMPAQERCRAIGPLGLPKRSTQDLRLPLTRDEEPALSRIKQPCEPDRDPGGRRGWCPVAGGRGVARRPGQADEACGVVRARSWLVEADVAIHPEAEEGEIEAACRFVVAARRSHRRPTRRRRSQPGAAAGRGCPAGRAATGRRNGQGPRVEGPPTRRAWTTAAWVQRPPRSRSRLASSAYRGDGVSPVGRHRRRRGSTSIRASRASATTAAHWPAGRTSSRYDAESVTRRRRRDR